MVPNAVNPQSWNRYSYVNNNPLKYRDPTGHWACDDQDDQGKCVTDKLGKLLDYVDGEILNKNNKLKNNLTSLAAMKKIVKMAATLYRHDWEGFLNATSFVFMGTSTYGAGAMLQAHNSGKAGLIDGDSGFHFDFQDADSSQQVRHFWAGFVTAADPTGNNPAGETMAYIGNDYHEITQDTRGGIDGATVEDYALTLTAIDIAKQAGNEIRNPMDLVEVLNYRLGPNGPGYLGQPIPTEWWWTPYN